MFAALNARRFDFCKPQTAGRLEPTYDADNLAADKVMKPDPTVCMQGVPKKGQQ